LRKSASIRPDPPHCNLKSAICVEAVRLAAALARCQSGPQAQQWAAVAAVKGAEPPYKQAERVLPTLARLREAVKNPRAAKDAKAQGFLRDAETVIEDKATLSQLLRTSWEWALLTGWLRP
jgi:hypothetical protein